MMKFRSGASIRFAIHLRSILAGKMFRKKVAGLVTIMVVAAFTAQAKPTHHHFFYFSWGYNGEWYTHSTVHVKQDALGNDYQLNDVRAHDHKGWDDHFFQQQLTIPQYNYRIGFMVNEEKGMGIEINFDHTKFIIADPQQAHLTGTFNHRATDTTFTYSQENGFYYYLNNGANFFLVNLRKTSTSIQVENGACAHRCAGKNWRRAGSASCRQ